MLSPSKHLLPPLLLLLLVTGVGCGASAEDGAVTFTLIERDGVPHAINEGENVWSDSASAPLQFELEQTFGAAEEPEEAMLGWVNELVADGEGAIYLLDVQNHRLVAFNSDGNLRWSAGREGQGPGEFENAHSLVWDGAGHLYLVNRGGGRIDRWSTDGTYVEGISTEEFGTSSIRLVGFTEDMLVATQSAMGSDPQPVYTIDTTRWTLEERFAIDLDLDLPGRMGMAASMLLHENELYAGHVDRYEINRYSLDGELQRRIVREVDYPTGPGAFSSNGRQGIMVFGTLSPVARLPEGYELTYVRWPTNIDDLDDYTHRRLTGGNVEDPVYTSAIDLFDRDGQLLGSLRWAEDEPSIGRPLHLSDGDKLYTYHTEPFPQVRRYDVAVALE